MTDDEDETPEGVVPVRFHWPTLVMHFFGWLGNLCNASGGLFHGVAAEVASHVQYKVEREQFAAEAGRELEKLVRGENGG